MVVQTNFHEWMANVAMACWPLAGALWLTAFLAARGASRRASGLVHALVVGPLVAAAGIAGAIAGITYLPTSAADPLMWMAPILGLAALVAAGWCLARLVIGAVDTGLTEHREIVVPPARATITSTQS